MSDGRCDSSDWGVVEMTSVLLSTTVTSCGGDPTAAINVSPLSLEYDTHYKHTVRDQLNVNGLVLW